MCTLSDPLLLFVFFSALSFVLDELNLTYVPAQGKVKILSHACYYTGRDACAVVKLPPLPLLLLLKLHVHRICAGAATAAVVRHRVPDDAICCCDFLHLIPVFIFICSNAMCSNPPLGKCCCMYSLDLPIILDYAHNTCFMHPRKLRACAEPRRAAARRGEALLGTLQQYYTTGGVPQ